MSSAGNFKTMVVTQKSAVGFIWTIVGVDRSAGEVSNLISSAGGFSSDSAAREAGNCALRSLMPLH